MTAPRDGLEGESPREALGNIVMAMREQSRLLLRAELWLNAGRDLDEWASRLERACAKLDAEKIAPEGPWRALSHPAKESGGMVHWIERPRNGKTRVLYFDSEAEAIAVRDALNRLGAVSPTEHPTAQDTPQ